MKRTERVATTPERLREAMAVSGKKQIDIAKETGMSHSTISRYLSGKVEPRQEAAHKLAIALGVSEFYLWGYDVPMKRTSEQKKNDDLAKVIVQLREDPEFFDVVTSLAGLPADRYGIVKQLISTLGSK